MRLLPTLCLFCATTPTILAQASFGLGDEIIIPSLGSYTLARAPETDHATVAINNQGDVCVAWHVRPSTGNQRQVEAAVIPRGQLYQWSKPNQLRTFLLGDPSLAILDTHEKCQKPDVVAIGGDFMVCWPRIDLVNNRARLEGALIEQDLVTGIWSVNQAQTGEGWVLDEDDPALSHLLTPGHAGLMPDLATRSTRPNTASVVYAHEFAAVGQGSTLELDYDLRCRDIDWSQTPPTLGPIFVCAQTAVDADISGTHMGGRVLPDLVEDDYGNLICAFEEYVLPGHGAAQSETSAIKLIRFREDFGNYLALDSRTFRTNPNSGLRLRRPSLATSKTDPKNTVSLAWLRLTNGGGDDDISYYEVEFQGQAGVGNVVAINNRFPNNNNRSDALPVVLHDAAFRGLLFSAFLPASTRKAIGICGNNRSVINELFSQSVEPWRCAAALRKLPGATPGSKWSRLVAVCWEGQLNTSSPSQIFLRLFRI